MGVAKQPTITREELDLNKYDRDPDVTMLRINAGARVNKDDVDKGIQDFIMEALAPAFLPTAFAPLNLRQWSRCVQNYYTAKSFA